MLIIIYVINLTNRQSAFVPSDTFPYWIKKIKIKFHIGQFGTCALNDDDILR